ncbi:uncharacterized protein BO66DRAFT_387092 [Aspergillus aculeatinus CBS 121060]|uniref:Uncharacterized protein n=1 Tax=Aspergillus aculeatinus CBS 121060 TaxID=1448322 RepID=A0ACD1HNH6_9EURO|nr:hypothetical protein BO66DRAFT_387092 [Aspergillus aculeatinus CBS 121060]RAH75153.1 hypothetical protein BO66DRAFT_387092 [Aspergillus aculeatinus CBS 121060]
MHGSMLLRGWRSSALSVAAGISEWALATPMDISVLVHEIHVDDDDDDGINHDDEQLTQNSQWKPISAVFRVRKAEDGP